MPEGGPLGGHGAHSGHSLLPVPTGGVGHCLSQKDWWSQECISHVCPVKDRVAPVSGLQDTGDPPPHGMSAHASCGVVCTYVPARGF